MKSSLMMNINLENLRRHYISGEPYEGKPKMRTFIKIIMRGVKKYTEYK